MAQNFGPGIQGGVVLIDPATGEPYRASGGGSTTGAWTYAGDWNPATEYDAGSVVKVTVTENPFGTMYVALEDTDDTESPLTSDKWRAVSGVDMLFSPLWNPGTGLVRNNRLGYDLEETNLLSYFDRMPVLALYGNWNDSSYWPLGAVVSAEDGGENGDAVYNLYICLSEYPAEEGTSLPPPQDPEHWAKLTGQGGASNAVLSDTTAVYSYMGVAPAGTAVGGDWHITRIPLSNPNAPLHATGAWTNRATLTYS